MIVLHANGIDLSTITLLTSALGIGIGFGIINIAAIVMFGKFYHHDNDSFSI
jgi:hypothetical protein